MSFDPKIEDWNWEKAFECCGPPEDDNSCVDNAPAVSAAMGSNTHASPFQRRDVKRVLATRDGENDERNWLGVFELKDGRFAFLSAGCDYTGWDCQSGGCAIVSHSLEHLIRFGIGEDDGVALGVASLLEAVS